MQTSDAIDLLSELFLQPSWLTGIKASKSS